MFTGLIEQQGLIVGHQPRDNDNLLLIESKFEDLQVGESIAVNGVCLTRLADFSEQLAFHVSSETLTRTTLGTLKQGQSVNLERAMLATSRFSGHYVTGHVDTTIPLKSRTLMGDYVELTLGPFEAAESQYLLPKGSIALDGVSLTINEVDDGCIKVLVIPHTLAVTTLGQRLEEDRLNVEFDYIARIVAQKIAGM